MVRCSKNLHHKYANHRAHARRPGLDVNLLDRAAGDDYTLSSSRSTGLSLGFARLAGGSVPGAWTCSRSADPKPEIREKMNGQVGFRVR